MLVATKNLDPTHEAEFNHWYDDIDIPDVLKVPGYKRARRGVRQTVTGFSAANQEAADGRYVALYDIETPNMDRTIIDMLMAAKKMDMTGRSIEALKVTERVYFRRLGGAVLDRIQRIRAEAGTPISTSNESPAAGTKRPNSRSTTGMTIRIFLTSWARASKG